MPSIQQNTLGKETTLIRKTLDKMGRTYLHFFRLLIFRSIVHDNFPIFGTKVYLAMPNAVLTFHHQKSLPFLNAKMFFFCISSIFTQNRPYWVDNSQFFYFSSLLAMFAHLNEFRPISRKRFKFELQLCYSLILKIPKDHFKDPSRILCNSRRGC